MEKEEMAAAGIGAADLLAVPHHALIVNLSIAAMKSDHWRSDGPGRSEARPERACCCAPDARM